MSDPPRSQVPTVPAPAHEVQVVEDTAKNPTPPGRWKLVAEQNREILRLLAEAREEQQTLAESYKQIGSDLAELRNAVQTISVTAEAARSVSAEARSDLVRYGEDQKLLHRAYTTQVDALTSLAWSIAHIENGLTNLRVLYVEDHDQVRYHFQKKIGALCMVMVAHNADAARGFLADNRFDVVILDIDLGGGDSGIDLALELRQKQPELPIAFITGGLFERASENVHDAFPQSPPPIFAKPGELPKVAAFLREMKDRMSPPSGRLG